MVALGLISLGRSNLAYGVAVEGGAGGKSPRIKSAAGVYPLPLPISPKHGCLAHTRSTGYMRPTTEVSYILHGGGGLGIGAEVSW